MTGKSTGTGMEATKEEAVVEQCGNCRFWKPCHDSVSVGYCRFSPPVPLVNITYSTNNEDGVLDGVWSTDYDTEYPELQNDEWCGQWKPVRGAA